MAQRIPARALDIDHLNVSAADSFFYCVIIYLVIFGKLDIFEFHAEVGEGAVTLTAFVNTDNGMYGVVGDSRYAEHYIARPQYAVKRGRYCVGSAG